MTGHEPRHPVLEATALSTVEQPLPFIDQVTGFATFDTALQQVIVPPHIPRIGQGGGILLLRYSMICVIGLAIFLIIDLFAYTAVSPTYLSTKLPTNLPTHPPSYLPTNLPIHQPNYLHTHQFTYPPT